MLPPLGIRVQLGEDLVQHLQRVHKLNDNVTALFDLETPFMKGFFEAPVMKGQESTLKWNTFGETEAHDRSDRLEDDLPQLNC